MNVALDVLPRERRIEVRVTLSRRNLRALLLKLGDADSRATIARDVTPGLLLVVRAENDEEHYRTRDPSRMTLWTEAALQSDLDGMRHKWLHRPRDALLTRCARDHTLQARWGKPVPFGEGRRPRRRRTQGR